ncbi:MAG: hypothetical protein AAF098_16900 [Pseudomonadota bacterium]
MTSPLETRLESQIKNMGLPDPAREYPFAAEHVGRGDGLRNRLEEAGLSNWLFDFAWPEAWLAVEVEGGAWVQGRHTRGKGFQEDLEKYHNAMAMGWTVYRCDGELIKSGRAVELIFTLFEILSARFGRDELCG